MINHALYYQQLGLNIIPAKGKIPVIPWKEYQYKKVNRSQVFSWWKKNPDANIGFIAGSISKNIIVVDVDDKEHLSFLKEKGFRFDTWIVKTGRGYHLYYYSKTPVKSTLLTPKIDLKGEASFVILPPSIHPSGVRYSWVKGHSPSSLDIKELPATLFEIKKEKTVFTGFKDILLNGVSAGTRNISLTRLVGVLFKLGLNLEETLEFTLKWNNFCQPPLEEKEVKKTVKSIWMRELNKKQAEQKIYPLTSVNAVLQEMCKNRLN